MADKLHNVRSILADYRRHKENLWMRFTAGKEEQFWLEAERELRERLIRHELRTPDSL